MLISDLTNMFVNDLASMFTSGQTNMFTNDIVKISSSVQANIFINGLANMFVNTSDLTNMFPSCKTNTDSVKILTSAH